MPNRLPQLRGCPASPGRQRGATLVFTAFTLVALVATLGLAIDVGRLYVTQTQLQRTAEVAALDAARAIGGCAVGEPNSPQDAAKNAAEQAILRHADDDGAPAITLEEGSPRLGIQESDGSLLSFAASDAFDADSVQVTLTRPAPTPLVAFFTADRPLTASATAISRPQAGISVGTSLARIGGLDGSEGILAALLGTNQVNLVSYNGLVDAELTVGDLLQADATIGGLNDLLTTNFTLPESLNLIADALDNVTAGTNALAANTLRDLANLADTGLTSRLDQVLNIEPGLENVINALPVDVTSLLTGLAQAANQGAPVALPVGIDLGGIARVNGTVKIIEPPQMAFGRAGRVGDKFRTTATTSQVAVQLRIEVLGALPSALGGALINLPIFIKSAGAKAHLTDINCAGPSNEDIRGSGPFQHSVHIDSDTSLVDIGIGEFSDISAFDPQPPGPNEETVLVNAIGIAQVVTTAGLQVTLGRGGSPTFVEQSPPKAPNCAPNDDNLIFCGPFPPDENGVTQTQSVDTPPIDALDGFLSDLSTQLADPDTLEVRVLGTCLPILCNLTSALLAPIVNTVVSLLQPVLDVLGTALLEPLLGLLGLDVGVADVTVSSVLVDQPRIYCTDRQCDGS
ncbi:pilus assembly protein TadG-related protein [Spectribacter hydrogenooxidans]|uniref:Pilus assembly protein TadG-related protein n=1 Tax=Spectribacter hydrogenoxidans TaxID=3075608 RepID=A0ABU3C460_9GAMM|nr:pilus assembly protein TadG-related protein [Salinisphaera sp. W335]MDT0636325.1 pilus assembly protein TadG-related protein [Salinisphaera sp. W335]